MKAPSPLAPRRAAALRARLLAWYRGHRRDLPWRGSENPWAILVSEIMLQQTTVAAVVPYWERFVARWPDAAALARADQDELLAAWAGLGYYRRARLLHDAARVLAGRGGELPRRAAELQELPGVGPYTAAAVASIAFGEPVACVDGNVERVLARLLALEHDPASASGAAAVRATAQALLDTRAPGDSNQALMELGATLCRPAAPDCPRCPLARSCAARAAGRPERWPLRAARAPLQPVPRAVALVERGARVLVRRRAESPNEGFFELPDVRLPLAGGARGLLRVLGDLPAARAALSAELAAHGLNLRLGDPLPVVRHVIMRWRMHALPLVGTVAAGRVRAPLAWVDPEDLTLPLTTLSRRILAARRAQAAR